MDTIIRQSTSTRTPMLLGVVYGAIAFQVVHAAEHLLQVGYWLAHPLRPPWITPWAIVGRDALAAFTDGHAASGNELLHLGGNLVFLAGLVAAAAVAQRWQLSRERTRWLRGALWLQTAHVVEHLVLTATWFLLGGAHGVSTVFGLLTPGTVLAGAVRVWLHLLIHLAATLLALGGLMELASARRQRTSGHVGAATTGPGSGGGPWRHVRRGRPR